MKKIFFISIVVLNFFSSILIAGSISISEVFRDGTDEWIELKIDESLQSSGGYILSGAKSSLLNLELPEYYTGYFLIYDGGGGIENTSACTSIGSQGLSLSDTKPLQIGLYFSGELIDTFSISSEKIEEYNNVYTSFLKNIEVIPYSGHSINMVSGNIGSPCYGEYFVPVSGTNSGPLFTGENSGVITGGTLTGNSENSTGTSESSILTGSVDLLTGSSSFSGIQNSPGLVEIIEIYPFDTDMFGEFIAIRTNGDISGKLEIYGLGQGDNSKIIYISMLAGEVAYITDSPGQFSTGQKVYVLPSISLTNSGEELRLKFNNSTITDTVQYSPGSEYESTFYSYTDGEKRIFSEVGTPSPSSSTFESTTCNITFSELQYHGGMISGNFFLESTIDFLCNMNSLVSFYSSGTLLEELSGCQGNVSFTGTISQVDIEFTSKFGTHCHEKIYLYGNGVTACNEEEEDSSHKYLSGDITIDEIYPYDELFPEYVEIVFMSGYDGELTIAGAGHGESSKSFFIEAYPGQRVIVSSTHTGFSEDVFVKTIPGISLTNGGEGISLYGQDGHLLDTVYFIGESEYDAQYFSSFSGNIRNFLTGSLPTPGFSYGMVRHLFDDDMSVSNCGIRLQHKTPIYASNKVNLIATFNEKELQNGSSYICNWLINMKVHPGLEGCNPSYIDIEGTGMNTVSLEITSPEGEICSVTSSLNFPEKPPKKSGKSPEYYEGLYKKWKGRYEIMKSGIKKLGFGVTSSGEVYSLQESNDLFESNILASGFILAVLPNPSGKDQGKEGIRIQNTLTGSIDLSQVKLRVNGKNKYLNLSGSLKVGVEKELVGTLGLTNKPSCVELIFEENLIDHFCYPQAQNDVWYTVSLPISRDVGDVKVLGDVTVSIEDESACLNYLGSTITCKQYGINLLDAKQRKKDIKKITSLQKNLEKASGKYDLLSEKYSKLKKKSSLDLSSARAEKSLLGSQKKLHQGFAKILISYLYENFSPITKQEDIKLLFSVYDQLEENKTLGFSEYGITIPERDIVSYLKIKKGLLTLHNTDVEKIESYLKSKISNGIQTFTLYTATSPP